MGNPTHRVTGYLTRSRSVVDADEERHFEPGDEIEPTERELRHHADLFEPLEGADDGADESDDESDDDASDSTDESEDAPTDDVDAGETELGKVADIEDESDDSSDDAEDESDAEDDTPEESEIQYSIEQIESAEYPRLRTMASQVDGVDGRSGEDEIRSGLLEAARGE